MAGLAGRVGGVMAHGQAGEGQDPYAMFKLGIVGLPRDFPSLGFPTFGVPGILAASLHFLWL